MKEYFGIVHNECNNHDQYQRTFSVFSDCPENAVYKIMKLYNQKFYCDNIEFDCEVEIDEILYEYSQYKTWETYVYKKS